MPWIASKTLQPGLVLSQDVLNMHGQHLLPAGHCLTGNDILFLASWGILEIEVQALPSETEPAQQDEKRKELRETLDRRFVRQDFSEPVVRQLLDACLASLEQEPEPHL